MREKKMNTYEIKQISKPKKKMQTGKFIERQFVKRAINSRRKLCWIAAKRKVKVEKEKIWNKNELKAFNIRCVYTNLVSVSSFFFFIYKKFGIAYVVFFGCHAVESDHLIYWNWTQFDFFFFFFFISLVREWVLVRCRRKKTLLALMYIYRRVCVYIFRLVYTIHCIAHISGFAAQGIRRNVQNIWSFFFVLLSVHRESPIRISFCFFCFSCGCDRQ